MDTNTGPVDDKKIKLPSRISKKLAIGLAVGLLIVLVAGGLGYDRYRDAKRQRDAESVQNAEDKAAELSPEQQQQKAADDGKAIAEEYAATVAKAKEYQSRNETQKAHDEYVKAANIEGVRDAVGVYIQVAETAEQLQKRDIAIQYYNRALEYYQPLTGSNAHARAMARDLAARIERLN